MDDAMQATDVVLDFRTDYRMITDEVLDAVGIALDQSESCGAAIYRYFANFLRRIGARPYRIVLSSTWMRG